MNIGDVCNRVVIYITADETAQRGAELMRKYHVGNLVVTASGDPDRVPVGIVTDRDIVVEVVAKGVDPNGLTVADIMSQDPLVASEEDEIQDTLDAMRELGVRRVPVVDRRRNLIGIFALDDVLQLMASNLGTVAAIVGEQRRQEAESRA
ncbi:MAG TPA: CBS domain-containing protein [Gammaproteobacteria bacterium]|nr:CBS domain-containing protein [Gammaproteobacteria bacterium]